MDDTTPAPPQTSQATRTEARDMRTPQGFYSGQRPLSVQAVAEALGRPLEAPPAAPQVIGKPMPLIDGVAKVCGSGLYSADLHDPQALCGRILRSPHAHARIVGIDTSRAEALPGVEAVVTGADVQAPFGVLPIARDEYALAREKVRYVGEEVAAVAAVDPWTAEQALALIAVEYEVLPAYLTPAEARAQDALLLHEHRPKNIEREVDHEFGNVSEGWARSTTVVAAEFFAPEVTHAQMEPHAALAHWDSSTERLTLWCSTQVPYYVHNAVSETLGVDTSAVRVIKPMIGGGFGCKTEAQSYELICALLARRAGGRVRVVLSREEVFYAHRGRPATWTTLKLGSDAQGHLQALEAEVIQQGGAYGGYGVVTILYAGAMLNAIYRLENLRYHGYRVLTNTPPNGAMRGHGTVDVRFAFESALDMLATRLGLSPVEIRRRNLLQGPQITPNDLFVNSYGLPECIDTVARSSRFEAKHGKLPFGRGIGFAASHYVSGSSKPVNRSQMPHAVVTLKLDVDGCLTLFTGAAEIGQGSSTVMLQIAAEALGLPPARFRVVAADSAITPKDNGSYSSRVTLYVGNATKEAAEKMRAHLLAAAAELLDCQPGQVILADETFTHAHDRERQASFAAVLEKALTREGILLTKGSYSTPSITHGGRAYRGAGIGATPAFSYSAQAVEVRVDLRSGQVHIEKVTVAHDCGFALNPLAVRGQIEGSVWMGLGQGRQEASYYEKGLPLSPNLLDYRVPTILESPPIETHIVESNESGGPFGAKEAGEGSLAAFLPAMANAIHDAIGVRITDLPLSPERVLAAIETEREKRRQERSSRAG